MSVFASLVGPVWPPATQRFRRTLAACARTRDPGPRPGPVAGGSRPTGGPERIERRATLSTEGARDVAVADPPPGAAIAPAPDPAVAGPQAESPGLAAPGMPAPGLAAPGLPAPGQPAPGLAAPGLPAPGLAAPGLTATDRIVAERGARAPAVSVIVPAYNEQDRLTSSIPRILDNGHLRPSPTTELIVVDDGSQDETASVARRELVDIEQARVLRLPWHAGKGAAVRLGVSAARGHTILFMDADLATNLAVVPTALELLADTHVVVGSRSTPGAVVRGRSAMRSTMHHVFSRHARRFAGVQVSDPQCGLKAFHADVAKILFHLARTDGFGFDVEILLLAAKLGFSVREVPVDWTAVDGSKVRAMRDPAAMARDITWARVRHGRRPTAVAYAGEGR